MVTCLPLLGVTPTKRLRVWYWSGEDPIEEIERRILAILIHFNIDPEEIKGRLFIDSGRETQICIAQKDKTVVNFSQDTEALIAEIIEREVDVLIIDPFVSSHLVPENDNGAIDAVIKQYARITEKANCAIELVHHVRKTNGNELTAEDGRGASALVNGTRSARVLNVMTGTEAVTAQIEEKYRLLYFRVGNGKTNMQPPAEKATWFKLVSVSLDNGSDMEPADNIGMVTGWKMPGVFAGRSESEDLAKACAALGPDEWAKNVQAANWAGYPISNALGLNVSDKIGKGRVSGMIKAWVEAGGLREISRRNARTGRDQVMIIAAKA